jgi:hypothetical protein
MAGSPIISKMDAKNILQIVRLERINTEMTVNNLYVIDAKKAILLMEESAQDAKLKDATNVSVLLFVMIVSFLKFGIQIIRIVLMLFQIVLAILDHM